MKITTIDGLDGIVPDLRGEIDRALAERKRLGLSVPGDFEARIGYHDSAGNYPASATYREDLHLLSIDTLPYLLTNLPPEEAGPYKSLMEYFDFVKVFFHEPTEARVLEFLEDPDNTLARFESGAKEKTGMSLEKLKKFYDEQGLPYEDRVGYMKANVDEVGIWLESVPTTVKRTAGPKLLKTLRHELDHIDIFSTPFYGSYVAKMEEVAESGKAFCEERVSPADHARVEMRFLRDAVKTDPIVETRAGFFSHIKLGQWGRADYEAVKRKVAGQYMHDYPETTQARLILCPLVARAWSEGKMDQGTSNYLLWLVSSETGDPRRINYEYAPEKADPVLVQRMRRQLTQWKGKFVANSLPLIDALGDAYATPEGRARIAGANKARTFDEYLELCAS